MVVLKDVADAWGSDQFNQLFKKSVEQLKNGDLPLTKAASVSGYIDDSDLSITIQSSSEHNGVITVEFGIFFGEIIVGCSCGDDPPVERSYSDMKAVINRSTGETEFKV